MNFLTHFVPDKSDLAEVVLGVDFPQVGGIFFTFTSQRDAPPLGTCLSHFPHKEKYETESQKKKKKNSSRQDSNTQLHDQEACGLPLSYNHCISRPIGTF